MFIPPVICFFNVQGHRKIDHLTHPQFGDEMPSKAWEVHPDFKEALAANTWDHIQKVVYLEIL